MIPTRQEESAHVFPGSGDYDVRLIIEDSNGQRNETIQTIHVTANAAPQARQLKRFELNRSMEEPHLPIKTASIICRAMDKLSSLT